MSDELKNTSNSSPGGTSNPGGAGAQGGEPVGNPVGQPVFREQPQEKAFPTAAVAIAAVVVVLAIVALLILGRGRTGPSGGAAYASNLVVTDLHVLRAESLSGGLSTYVDGHVVNQGDKTVTGATVEAEFAGAQTQTLSAPVSIIRTRQPYVDTEPMSSAPLAPGGQADFRLIFEGVSDNWNQQMPALRVVQVSTK